MHRVLSMTLFAAVLGGCVAAQGDESFVIEGILQPPESGCSFTPSDTGPFLSRGFVDFLSPGYFVGAQFRSRIEAADGKESLRTIFVQGANVSLEVIGDGITVTQGGSTTTQPLTLSQTEFSVSFTAPLPPNSGTAVGSFDLIPPQLMGEINTAAGAAANDPTALVQVEVDATVTAFGDFYGDRLDSTSFKFPVVVTNGQRQFFGACPLSTSITIPVSTNGCSDLQDTDIACCVADGTVSCPAPIAFCGDGVCTTADEDNMSCPADCP